MQLLALAALLHTVMSSAGVPEHVKVLVRGRLVGAL